MTTEIDTAKTNADIRILAVDGTYTVVSKVSLKGRGVTPRSAVGYYEVTGKALDRLQKQYDVRCDF